MCLYVCGGEGKGVGSVFWVEMLKCQIALADMGLNNAGDSMCHLCKLVWAQKRGYAWFSVDLWDQGGWR